MKTSFTIAILAAIAALALGQGDATVAESAEPAFDMSALDDMVAGLTGDVEAAAQAEVDAIAAADAADAGTMDADETQESDSRGSMINDIGEFLSVDRYTDMQENLEWIEDLYQTFCMPVDTKDGDSIETWEDVIPKAEEEMAADDGKRFLADEEESAMMGEDKDTWSPVNIEDEETPLGEDEKTWSPIQDEDEKTWMPDVAEIAQMTADGMSADEIAEWIAKEQLMRVGMPEDFSTDDWMINFDMEMPTLDEIKDVHAQICGAIKTFQEETTSWNEANDEERKEIEDGWTSEITTFFSDLLQDGSSALVAGAALATSVTLLAF